MTVRSSPNRDILLQVAAGIRPLLPEVVFVGGQVAELLITVPEATWVRPTKDVDVVVKATTRTEYRKIENELSRLGLRPDSSEGAPICRWRTEGGLLLDVMPLDQDVLGFGSRWYGMVVRNAVTHQLTESLEIRVPPAPLYLATKWEAFLGRGEGDHLGSHDLEDVISVVAGRPEIVEEFRQADREVRIWVGEVTRDFLAEDDAGYAILGALPDAATIPEAIEQVRQRFSELATLDGVG